MGVRVDQAMAQVRKVFGQYPKPKVISYCSQCYAEDEVRAFVKLPVEGLSERDLEPIVYYGGTCFGDWSELAHYVPRLLEVCSPQWGNFPFGLPHLFLIAARVKLNSMLVFPDEVETKMSDSARAALFQLGQAILEDDLDAEEEDRSWSIRNALSFLAAFDAPIAPLLKRLENSERFSTRANFTILIAGLASGLEIFDDCMVSNWSMLPENQAIFDQLLAPANALEMLMANIDEIVSQWPESGEELSVAFDTLALRVNM